MALRTALITFICSALIACANAEPKSSWAWKEFVQVDGQPEPVPAQWVSTLEGKFAHSIKIPNPVPKDSGYKSGMSNEEYFKHLCDTEAGEFIYKTNDNVEGFYFMRPPRRPTDSQLQDRWALEAPEIERTFQLYRENPIDRSTLFIVPSVRRYKYLEEMSAEKPGYVLAFGMEAGVSPKPTTYIEKRKSRYGLVWRGIRREHDRDSAIAGGEWIVLDLETKDVMAVMRNYGLTGKTSNTPLGVWWLNAVRCQQIQDIYKNGDAFQIYGFISKTIRPKQ